MQWLGIGYLDVVYVHGLGSDHLEKPGKSNSTSPWTGVSGHCATYAIKA